MHYKNKQFDLQRLKQGLVRFSRVEMPTINKASIEIALIKSKYILKIIIIGFQVTVLKRETRRSRKRFQKVLFTDSVRRRSTMDDIVRKSKFSSLSEPDIRGVIIAIENTIQDKLAQGKIIRLERLGTFYPSISSKGEANASDLSVDSIKKVNVNYHPGDRIKKALKDASINKVS